MICIAMIWILSLIPIFPEMPLTDVEFADKWVHIVMYGCTFIVVWIEYTRKHKHADYEKLFFWAWLAPIVMSGVLELLQEYCTGGRRSGLIWLPMLLVLRWLLLLDSLFGVFAPRGKRFF